MQAPKQRDSREIWRAVRRRLNAVLSPTTLVLGIAVLVLGLLGYTIQQFQQGSSHWDQVPFKAFQLLTLQAGTETTDNVFLVAGRLGALVLGCLVAWKALALLLRDSTDAWRLARPRNHTVVCGLGRIGMHLLEDMIRHGSYRDVVIIEPNEENPNLRRARELNAVVVIGDATDHDTLSKARITRARTVFAVTGSDDSNIETAVNVCTLMEGAPTAKGDSESAATPTDKPAHGERRSTRLNCYAHIVDPTLAELFQRHPVFRNRHDQVEVGVFNVSNNAARQLIVERIAHDRPEHPHEIAHYVILGFGPMGECLALHLAQFAHFENTRRCRLSVFASKCGETEQRFRSRYPRFTPRVTAADLNRADPEAEDWSSRIFRPAPELQVPEPGIEYVSNAVFREMPPHVVDDGFIAGLEASLSHSFVKPAIFVCLPQDRDNFDTAVRLRDRLSAQQLDRVPIYAWIPRQPALAKLLGGDARYARSLFAFGECRDSASLQEVTQPAREVLAKALHRDFLSQPDGENESHPARCEWSELGEDLRASNRAAADHAAIKLAAAGYPLKPETGLTNGITAIMKPPESLSETLAQMEHNRWVAEKLIAGWHYAKQRSEPQRTHPGLSPWQVLPNELRVKDHRQVAQLFRVLNAPPYAVVQVPQA